MQIITDCSICEKPVKPVFAETVLCKYEVSYGYCRKCGLLKTETPYWLDEAYSEAIAATDVGLIDRNRQNSQWLPAVLECLSVADKKLLDVGGGYGLLTRFMRDKGFDCYSTDKHCKNLFAQYFEPNDDFSADVLLAFEVLEHLEDPVKFLDDVFCQFDCKTLIFSTLTFHNSVPTSDWWYYSFDTGQHITFYQPRTLSKLAQKFGCKYYALRPGYHLITNIEISGLIQFTLSNRYLFKLFSLHVWHKRRGMSKTWADHELIRQRSRTAKT